MFCFFLFGAGLTYIQRPPIPTDIHRSTINYHTSPGKQTRNKLVKTKILGSGVRKPGIYHLSADSRVIDLIKKAGGVKKGALIRGIPWQQKLYNNLTLNLPSRQALSEVKQGDKPLTNKDLITFRKLKPGNRNSDLTNINRAPAEKIMFLPGIGKILANRIVKNRKEEGPFLQKSDVTRIRGIGEGKLEQIKPLITVR